jgi:hypothetical protein
MTGDGKCPLDPETIVPGDKLSLAASHTAA